MRNFHQGLGTLLVSVALAAGGLAGCSGDTSELTPNDGADAGTLPPPDAGVAPDAGFAPDAEPLPTGQARVYPRDPLVGGGQLEQVTLPAVTDPDGHLTNAFAAVSNCLNEPGGPTSTQSLGGFPLTISFCHEVPTATPDGDGNYLEIAPPTDERDPNDAFAELMMYYHVNRIHGYFAGVHGFTGLDYPLPALVNVQYKIEPSIPFIPTNPDGWSDFPNAAFFPKESWNELAAQLGFPPRDQDAIIFGQAQADFSYDASVIYHEYTHAMIGKDKLNARIVDEYGLDDMPRGMNEGLADYFAATKLDDPVTGRYGIGKLSPNLVRDLGAPHRCPDDLTAEVHADGKILGSALWALRTTLGAEAADAIVFKAVQQFTPGTDLATAGALLVAEAAKVSAFAEEGARAALAAHGVLACERVKPWVAFDATTSAEGLSYPVEGTSSVGVPGFRTWVPGFFGFVVDVPAGTRGVQLDWVLAAAGGLGGFGGGGAPPKLSIAVRKGAPVTLQLMGVAPSRTEDAYLDVPAARTGDGGATQTVTLGASCLPEGGGKVYLMFVNQGASQAQIGQMAAPRFLETDAAAGPTVFDCLPPG